MRFKALPIQGVFEVEAEPHADMRGAFARLYCPAEFASAGIDFNPVQINLSTNPARGTLRGLHFQDPPFAEAKLVRAVRGRAFVQAMDVGGPRRPGDERNLHPRRLRPRLPHAGGRHRSALSDGPRLRTRAWAGISL
jgi:hypothetical protein